MYKVIINSLKLPKTYDFNHKLTYGEQVKTIQTMNKLKNKTKTTIYKISNKLLKI